MDGFMQISKVAEIGYGWVYTFSKHKIEKRNVDIRSGRSPKWISGFMQPMNRKAETLLNTY